MKIYVVFQDFYLYYGRCGRCGGQKKLQLYPCKQSPLFSFNEQVIDTNKPYRVTDLVHSKDNRLFLRLQKIAHISDKLRLIMITKKIIILLLLLPLLLLLLLLLHILNVDPYVRGQLDVFIFLYFEVLHVTLLLLHY